MLDEAIAYATRHNVTVVVAAGNGGSSDAGHDGYPAASSPSAVRVAGVDRNGALFSWSNRGSWVDIAAPGSVAALLANGTVVPRRPGHLDGRPVRLRHRRPDAERQRHV